MPPVEEILSLPEAQALILGRARPLAAETLSLAEAAGRFLAEPARALVDLPPFRTPRWTATRFAPGTRRESCRSSIGSPPERLRHKRSRPARQWGSRPAGSYPRARMPSSSTNWLSRKTTASRSPLLLPRERTCVSRAAMSRQALSSLQEAFGSARRRSARSRRRGSPRSSARAARGRRCSPRERSSAGPALRSPPARSTRRTA